MPDYNLVLLMGNLTREPELRYTTSGSAVCNLGLAVNRRFTDQSGQSREDVLFVDVDTWNRQAETCQQYLHKGDPIMVEGRLRMDSWDDRETGKKRTKLGVTATRVQFLSGPSRGNFSGGGDDDGAAEPRGGGGYNQGGGRQGGGHSQQGGGGGGYNQGGGGGYNQGGGGGGGYNQGAAPPPRNAPPRNAPPRNAPPPPRQGPPPQARENVPPFPEDEGGGQVNDAFNVDDEEPIDDIPF